MRNNILFIIDPQKSFLGYQDGQPYQGMEDGKVQTAELPVPGAVEDMQRLAAFIDSDANGEGIDDILFTLDTHEARYGDRDVGHPHYWKDAAGNHPAPFTVVSFQDVVDKKWLPHDPALSEKVLNYLSKVGAQVIWPRHCILGTWGHDIYDPLAAAIERWEERTGTRSSCMRKGMNCDTEQYGAFEAAVPDPEDPTTQFNWTLLKMLKRGTRVWSAGIAKSHCVKTSLEQAADKLSAEERSRWTLLEDCMSSVPTFEAVGDAFVADMRSRGMKIEKTAF